MGIHKRGARDRLELSRWQSVLLAASCCLGDGLLELGLDCSLLPCLGS